MAYLPLKTKRACFLGARKGKKDTGQFGKKETLEEFKAWKERYKNHVPCTVLYLEKNLDEVLRLWTSGTKYGYLFEQLSSLKEGQIRGFLRDINKKISLLENLKTCLKIFLLRCIHYMHLFSSINIAALDERYRECSLSLVKKSIEFCSELEGKIVIVHLHANGVFFNPRDEVKVIGKIRECLNEIAIFAKKMGVQVAVENGSKVDGWSFGSNIPKILRLIEDTGNDNLGLCLDTGHILSEKKTLIFSTTVLQCGKYLIALHIRDTDGKKDQHWVCGRGIIDWRQLFRDLKAINYQGMLTLEVTGNEKCAGHNVDNVLKEAIESVETIYLTK